MSSQLPTYVTESIADTLKNEGIEDHSVSFEGKTDLGDGYATDIFFVGVTGKKGGKTIELPLAVKVEKFTKAFGDPDQMKRFYERESRVYSQIFPAFTNFFRTSMDYVPKCYNTLTREGRNIIIFENLRKRNFVLHDRLESMNQQHIKMILKSYSHFHAFSFAMQDQNPEKFREITQDYDSNYLIIFKIEFGKIYDISSKKTLDIFKGLDAGIAAKFERTTEKGAKQLLLDLLGGELKEYVITHGDAWNNNFLFRYGDGDKDTPSEAMVMDWQLSSLQSPTVDLLHFLFLSSSTEQIEQFDELLKSYHDNLSRNISDLGNDPEKLFPFSSFMEHWNSGYGLITASSILPAVLSDPDRFDFDDYDNGQQLLDTLTNRNSGYVDRINERLLALARYYYKLNGQ